MYWSKPQSPFSFISLDTVPGETPGVLQCLLKAAFGTRVRDFCSSKLPAGLKDWQEMVAVISKLFYYPHLGIQEEGSCDSLVKELSGLILESFVFVLGAKTFI